MELQGLISEMSWLGGGRGGLMGRVSVRGRGMLILIARLWERGVGGRCECWKRAEEGVGYGGAKEGGWTR